jgi:hypothetical protein
MVLHLPKSIVENASQQQAQECMMQQHAQAPEEKTIQMNNTKTMRWIDRDAAGAQTQGSATAWRAFPSRTWLYVLFWF